MVEPFAALAAVLAVGIAISLYVVALAEVDIGRSADMTAETTLDRVHRTLADGTVVRPARLSAASGVAPTGYEINVTLRADGETWRAGPIPPESAERATRRVSVRLAPGRIRPGRLTVVIWS